MQPAALLPVSLIIPVYNESNSIEDLLATIHHQTLFPAQIILVDGGSTDDTVKKVKALTIADARYKVIEAGRAMPGEGRNLGAAAATTEWIAFTDAGIKLEKTWMEELVKKVYAYPDAAIIYGNYSPQQNSFFDKCATICYVPPKKVGAIRGQSIVSCLLKKEVWQQAGGFPGWRAAEDLIFMENVTKLNYTIQTAPAAFAYWQLQPNIAATFKKFDLYSKYNVWANRQAYWHYGIARQYLIVIAFILAAIFHHWAWLIGIPVWLLARAGKRIFNHRNEFGIATLFNPLVIALVIVITLVIDFATFSGWLKAIFHKKIV